MWNALWSLVNDIENGTSWVLYPTLQKDVHAFIHKCIECQKFGPIHLLPVEGIQSIITPWPFTTWEMYILDHYPMGKGQGMFSIVVIDYFTIKFVDFYICFVDHMFW